MNSELEAIKNAWDKQTGSGREEDLTRKLADEYVQANPEKFTNLLALSTFESTDEVSKCPDCGIESGIKHPCGVVRSLSVFRSAGFEESQWECEIWLLHHFEPQIIGGPVRAQVRLPGVNNG